ncbi:MerR family transcriptional regulator [Solimonas marina]|uniref:MerR family transcriptional regulator n=1 Tax=Solimonas marina TaxID=2714601 RepID=A0A969WCH1_9GAMM|nr:MerR family transcriptional regulator [Solimonas marina]NKF24677.1 MerR family transcriptional regulator [Solimonas marina]
MRSVDKPLAILPDIPRKRYFAIGEVSELCDVKPHVLRYWEQEFPQLKPVKRRGNRRYYQHEDVQMVRRIRSLLYEQGFTIGGARQRLKEMPRLVSGGDSARPGHAALAVGKPRPVAAATGNGRNLEVQRLRDELESLLRLFPE